MEDDMESTLGSTSKVEYPTDWSKIVLVLFLLGLFFGGAAYLIFVRGSSPTATDAKPKTAMTLSLSKVA